jgi:uncharacterized protein
MIEDCLIIFTRYPEPGKAKTRLIPALGAEGAATLHRQMAERTLLQARDLQKLKPLAIEVWFVGGNTDLMATWLGEDLIFQVQIDGDLGDRLLAAFQNAFAKGHRRVVVIGTDCPVLNTAILAQSFTALQQSILTIGPTQDGGYYLIGLQHCIPELFSGIPWSTPTVFTDTLNIAERLHITPALLPCLYDIDLPQDLEKLQTSVSPTFLP